MLGFLKKLSEAAPGSFCGGHVWHFRQKTLTRFKNCHKLGFQAKSKNQTWSCRELTCLDNGYLGFSKFWIFQTIFFQNIIFFKKQHNFRNFQDFQKTEIYIRGNEPINTETKFEVHIYINVGVIALELLEIRANHRGWFFLSRYLKNYASYSHLVNSIV